MLPLYLEKTMSEQHILCVECRGVFTDAETEHVTSCPRCGTAGIPADLREMLDLKITRHELRILTIWATNYAQKLLNSDPLSNAPNCVQGILNGIRAQHPGIGPLSLQEELQDVADTFRSKVESSIGDFDPKTRQ